MEVSRTLFRITVNFWKKYFFASARYEFVHHFVIIFFWCCFYRFTMCYISKWSQFSAHYNEKKSNLLPLTVWRTARFEYNYVWIFFFLLPYIALFTYDNDIIFHFWWLHSKLQAMTKKGAKNELLIFKSTRAVIFWKNYFFHFRAHSKPGPAYRRRFDF